MSFEGEPSPLVRGFHRAFAAGRFSGDPKVAVAPPTAWLLPLTHVSAASTTRGSASRCFTTPGYVVPRSRGRRSRERRMPGSSLPLRRGSDPPRLRGTGHPRATSAWSDPGLGLRPLGSTPPWPAVAGQPASFDRVKQPSKPFPACPMKGLQGAVDKSAGGLWASIANRWIGLWIRQGERRMVYRQPANLLKIKKNAGT